MIVNTYFKYGIPKQKQKFMNKHLEVSY